MHGRHTPPAPLERGGLGACYLLVIGGLCGGFPLLRGDKGCVTARGAGWDEVILLLFGGVVFLVFGWLFWV